MKSILHISYDLRDRHNREITSAVKNLINETGKLLNTIIFDLVRVPTLKEEIEKIELKDYYKLNVLGFPFGLLLIWHLKRAYNKIKNILLEEEIDLNNIQYIHAHKLTFEGYIGYKIAKEIDLPLFVTIRGTDLIVQKYRPDLKSLYKDILKYSSKVFFLLPGMKNKLIKLYGNKFYRDNIEHKVVFLPNIIKFPEIEYRGEVDKKSFLIVSRMQKKTVRSKNMKRLLKAFSMLEDKSYKLKIIGGGEYTSKVEEWISKYKLHDRVELLGAIENSKIHKYYSEALAYLMPSVSESFGMAYFESLYNGTPILYPKGMMDGIFDNIGSEADPLSTNSIKEAIEDIIKNNDKYRKNIYELKKINAFNIFSPHHTNKILKDVININEEQNSLMFQS